MGAGSDSKMSGRSDAGQMWALTKTVGGIDVSVEYLHLLKYIISLNQKLWVWRNSIG